MLRNSFGSVQGAYRLQRSSTVQYAAEAKASGRYHGWSVSTANYRSTLSYPAPTVSNIKPLPAGWSRTIEARTGRFVYERVTGRTIQRQYFRPHSNPVASDGYVADL